MARGTKQTGQCNPSVLGAQNSKKHLGVSAMASRIIRLSNGIEACTCYRAAQTLKHTHPRLTGPRQKSSHIFVCGKDELEKM